MQRTCNLHQNIKTIVEKLHSEKKRYITAAVSKVYPCRHTTIAILITNQKISKGVTDNCVSKEYILHETRNKMS